MSKGHLIMDHDAALSAKVDEYQRQVDLTWAFAHPTTEPIQFKSCLSKIPHCSLLTDIHFPEVLIVCIAVCKHSELKSYNLIINLCQHASQGSCEHFWALHQAVTLSWIQDQTTWRSITRTCWIQDILITEFKLRALSPYHFRVASKSLQAQWNTKLTSWTKFVRLKFCIALSGKTDRSLTADIDYRQLLWNHSLLHNGWFVSNCIFVRSALCRRFCLQVGPYNCTVFQARFDSRGRFEKRSDSLYKL